jgi:hypothetical protein
LKSDEFAIDHRRGLMSSTPTQITAAKLRDLVVALKWLYRQLTSVGAARRES